MKKLTEENADYANKYWDILTIWTNYLVEYGQDPESQLCADDSHVWNEAQSINNLNII